MLKENKNVLRTLEQVFDEIWSLIIILYYEK